MKKLLLLLLVGLLGFSAQAAEKKPNFIFIMVDDAGYGDFGCYGQKLFATPNIDRMAAKGMRFTQHYSGSTVCAPTRCSIMNGVHTGHAYVRVCPARPLLDNAIERFLGRDRREVARVATDTLEGAARGVIAAMIPDEAQDPERLRDALLLEVTHDLERLGLEVDTLSLSASLS